MSAGTGIPGLNRNDAYAKEIPLPSLDIQHEIVAAISEEEQVVESCRGLVSIYETKISATIARLWGEEPQQ
jgi:restriction endonuclease S subunit